MKYNAKLDDNKFIIVDSNGKIVFLITLDEEVEGSVRIETEREVYEGPLNLLKLTQD